MKRMIRRSGPAQSGPQLFPEQNADVNAEHPIFSSLDFLRKYSTHGRCGSSRIQIFEAAQLTANPVPIISVGRTGLIQHVVVCVWDKSFSCCVLCICAIGTGAHVRPVRSICSLVASHFAYASSDSCLSGIDSFDL